MVRQIVEPVVAAIVVGNGFTKGQNEGRTIFFPSVIGISQTAFSGMDFGGGEKSASSLLYQNSNFVWGEAAYTDSLLQAPSMGNQRVGTVTYTRLLLAALYELFGAQDVQLDILITTLPVMNFENEREKSRALIGGSYSLADGNGNRFNYVIPTSAVKILPEGLPTLYSFLYSKNLNVKEEGLLKTKRGDAAKTGVVNIGTYTTDLILIQNQQPIKAQCHSINVGLNKVWEQIIRYVNQQFGLEITAHEADKVCKTGYVYVGKTPHDISNVIREMMEQASEAIAQEINTKWNMAKELQNLIFGGGGAPQMAEFFADRYLETEVYSYESIEKSASTETDGLIKSAKIKLGLGQR